MPQRQITLGLLLLAMAALLALLALLLSLRGIDRPALDAALALNLALLPLPPLGIVALHRRHVAARAAKATTDTRTRFLAQLSHEIRTPMNAIMGMTQLALQTPLSPEQRDLLTRADAASRTLLGLVNDALDAARMEAGQLRIESQPLRLEDVVEQAMELLRPLHTNPAVALVCDWADPALLGARGLLRGDAQRLQQVLLSLLANAVRVTPAGQVLLRLSARPADEQGGVPLVITVQDNSIGQSPEQVPGLGLARRLVELMGGRLEMQSQPGRGCLFEIQLALPRDTSALPPEPPKPCRVLLAEGHAASREATRALLGHLGLPGAQVAADVPATLAALDAARLGGQPVEWLLLDWHLPGPGVSGAELLARLRRDHPGVRVAVLNPPRSGDDPAHARAFGARASCPQPLLPGELRRLLGDTHAERPPIADGQPLAHLRVLLVEDNPVNQEIALRLLGSRGASVEVAGNGQEGLERLLARGPGAFDLVLMDLQMPVLDGLSATRRLRELPGFERLPVVAMTAHALAEERTQCLAAGMQGHIAKPLDSARLVRELQRYQSLPAQPPAAPVLDMASGLRHFDGLAALYRRTLEGFAAQYAGGLGEWAGWLQRGEWAELRRAAHTLQGLAATVGAQPLHRAALALERSAAAADAGTAAGQLARAASGLEALLAEVRTVLADGGAAPEPQGPGDIAELHRLLTQSDSRALDWWQSHGAHTGLDAGITQRLQQALASLDFDAALHALEGKV